MEGQDGPGLEEGLRKRGGYCFAAWGWCGDEAGTACDGRMPVPLCMLRGGDGFEGAVGDLPDGVWLERGIGPEEVGGGDEFLGVGREG